MGTFNRGIRDDKRKLLAGRLAQFLGVSEPVPETFEGIPILNNQRSWYFPYASERAADHIDALWDVFLAAISLADSSDRDEDLRAGFAKAFDNAIGLPVVGWNLTMGLYWARPWAFVTLDNNSKAYIATKLQVPIGLHGPKKRCSSADYFAVMNAVEPRFQEASYPVHPFPELSLQAWKSKAGETSATTNNVENDDHSDAVSEATWTAPPIVPYGIEDVMQGCFLDRSEVELIIKRLRSKKSLILQGPPGTGKTWLAKRLVLLS